MIVAVAVDDEPPALRIIETFCKRIESVTLIKTFTNPKEALDFISENKVDLIFLDIQMPTMSGFDFYTQLLSRVPVVFTTAYAEYAVTAFNVEAVDYLLKPFSFERFEQAMAKVQFAKSKNKTPEEHYVFVKIDYSIQRINCNTILYIEALDDYIKIHLENLKSLIVRQTLKSILEKLPKDNFIRVHRSYIVSLDKINKIENKTIIIKSIEIPISNSYELDFNQAYKLR